MGDATHTGETTLRVAEAFVEDAGRGWARVDPADLTLLGAAPGDALLLAGGRTTVARAAEAPPSHRGQRLVLVDGGTRGNAQVGVDERVRVRRVPFRTASSLLLAAVQPGLPLPADAELPALRQLLSGRALVLGDRLEACGFGARPRWFTVEGATPRGALVVSSDTEIAFRAADVAAGEAARVSYEDIGGLDREVALVREMVELPLRLPELFGRATQASGRSRRARRGVLGRRARARVQEGRLPRREGGRRGAPRGADREGARAGRRSRSCEGPSRASRDGSPPRRGRRSLVSQDR